MNDASMSGAAAPGPVLIRIADGVAHVTLNRPAKRNALDRATIAGLTAALAACARDPAVRVVQLTGAGAVFCAGADLANMQHQAAAGAEENLADARGLAELLLLLDGLPKPTLARVNGDGYGGALGLLAACDIVVAVAHARFAFTEVRLGLVPAVISPFVLAKIGESAARRYFLSAETLSTADLKELRLVHEVADAAGLDATCERIVDALLAGAPGAQTEAKRLIRDVSGHVPAARSALADDLARRLAQLRVQAEAQEGFAAFFARRPPAWRIH